MENKTNTIVTVLNKLKSQEINVTLLQDHIWSVRIDCKVTSTVQAAAITKSLRCSFKRDVDVRCDSSKDWTVMDLDDHLVSIVLVRSTFL